MSYTQPPVWFTRNLKNKDAVVELTKVGWVATFPNGRKEIIQSMKNVPDKYLKGAAKPAQPVKEKVEVPVVEDVVETVKEPPVVEEEPKKRGRKKKEE